MQVAVDSYVFALAILYFLLLAFVFYQVLKIWWYKYNWFSYQTGFLLLCLLWCLSRALFWLTIFGWNLDTNVALSYLVQGIGYMLQFFLFSFLLLFYAQTIEHHEHPAITRSTKTTVVAATVNVLVFIGFAVLVGLAYYFETVRPSLTSLDDVGKVWLAYGGMMFLALTAGLFYFVVRTWRLLDTDPTFCIPLLPGQQHSRRLVYATAAIMFVFLSRALRDVIAAFGVGNGGFSPRAAVREQALAFFMYFVWEIVPTLIVLFFFCRVSLAPPSHSMYDDASIKRRVFASSASRHAGSVNSPEPPYSGSMTAGEFMASRVVSGSLGIRDHPPPPHHHHNHHHHHQQQQHQQQQHAHAVAANADPRAGESSALVSGFESPFHRTLYGTYPPVIDQIKPVYSTESPFLAESLQTPDEDMSNSERAIIAAQQRAPVYDD